MSGARRNGLAGDHRVVIVGGGFAGLEVARALPRGGFVATVVDRRNFHLFQPLLYQVATGGLSPADIATPLRAVLARRPNVTVLRGEVVDVDPATRAVVLADGARLAYDTLVVATGTTHDYFGRDDLARRAPGLKTLEDATAIRSRILDAFEHAERDDDPESRRDRLTFVVVGGGPTGVELAGAIGELARATLRDNFRRFDPASARVVLVEAGEDVLPSFPPGLRRAARRSLESLGIEVRTGTRLVAADRSGVTVASGSAETRIPCSVVLWAAGVRASALGGVLRDRVGAELDRAGRVIVNPDATVPGHPDIFVLGDLARLEDSAGRPLPGIAPVAMQMGRYAARAIVERADGRSPAPFRYRDKGSLAVIGRAAAVAWFGRVRVTGYPAWLLWLFVHLLYLVEFENRLLVLVQWGWNYLTRNRSARLITGPDPDANGS